MKNIVKVLFCLTVLIPVCAGFVISIIKKGIMVGIEEADIFVKWL